MFPSWQLPSVNDFLDKDDITCGFYSILILPNLLEENNGLAPEKSSN
jgi:hypothetical protein